MSGDLGGRLDQGPGKRAERGERRVVVGVVDDALDRLSIQAGDLRNSRPVAAPALEVFAQGIHVHARIVGTFLSHVNQRSARTCPDVVRFNAA